MNASQLTKIIVAAVLVAAITSSIICFAFISSPTLSQERAWQATLVILPVVLSVLSLIVIYLAGIKPFFAQLHETLKLAKNALPANSEYAKRLENQKGISALHALLVASSDQLNEARRLQKSIVENAADVICLIDINSAILEVNPACTSVWGYKPDELIGHRLTEFLISDDVDDTLKTVLGAAQSIVKLNFENRFRKKSGEIVELLWSGHWSATQCGLFCVAHDITKRKQAEQLLRESEERIRGVLESLPVGVLVLDKDGSVSFMNKTARTLTSYDSGADLSGLKASSLLSFCKEPFVLSQLDEFFDKQKNQTIECYASRSNGTKFPAEVSLSRLRIGAEMSCLVSFTDQTDRVELERSKRDFFAMVSHDLRAPLMAVQIFLDILSQGSYGQLDERGQERLSGVVAGVERLTRLVNDLLDMERLEANAAKLLIREVELVDIIEQAVDSLQSFADEQGVKLKAEDTDALVMGDCDRLVQVLVNLLSNAVKFSRRGESVSITVQESPDQFVTVSVTDRGRGIPAQFKDLIFDRFKQVEIADAKELGGTGLGLPICKVIMQQHGGEIGVSSEEGKGSTFWIRIPAAGQNSQKGESDNEKRAAL